jgi:DNA-3-methyladenine glycosylase
MPARLPHAFFQQPVEAIAQQLIGTMLLFDGAGGVIVETEAYHRHDPASHSFRGQTPRNAVTFGPVGRAYIYLSHGLHHCLCFVGGLEAGSAVLVRAIEPTREIERMMRRRGMSDVRLLCSGPGRLCAALGIDLSHNGLSLHRSPFRLACATTTPDVVAGPRIGISKAVEVPWRFGAAHSRFLSKPF